MYQILFLNDIAGTEILLILVFVLIFFGAKSIPGIAKTMGKAIYQIKNASDDLKSEIKNSTGNIKKDLKIANLSAISEIDEAFEWEYETRTFSHSPKKVRYVYH